MTNNKPTIKTLLVNASASDLSTHYPKVHSGIETIVRDIEKVNNPKKIDNIREEVYLAVSKYLDENSQSHNAAEALGDIKQKIEKFMSKKPTADQLLQVI